MHKFHSKLYLYNNYIKYICNLYNKNQLPSSTLFYGKEGIGKKSFVLSLLSIIQDNNLISNFQINKHNDYVSNDVNFFFKICSNQNANIKFISNVDKNISIEDIREVSIFIQKSSFNNKPKFIVICNPEHMNIYACNALLKILECPPDNTFFLLVSNNLSMVIETIKSRCLNININFTKKQLDLILNNLLMDYELKNYKFDNSFIKFDTPGVVISKINFLKKNNLLSKSLLEAIVVSLENYKISRSPEYLSLSLNFLSIYFKEKLLSNFSKYNYIYLNFIKNLTYCIKFNNDINFIISFMKNLSNEK